jgi:VEFS-Box of polycomb protein
MAVRRKLDTDVADDNSRDFIFNRRGQEAPTIALVPVVQRQARNAATLDLQTRKKKIRLLQEIGAKASIVQSFMPSDTVPLRQYYHSRTNEPMLDRDWGLDSDDEEDDDWLHQMGEAVRLKTCLSTL